MALIDASQFERAKLLAAAEWTRRGDGELAAAFAGLGLASCGFGMDSRSRLCWATVLGGTRIGLAFGLESGEYERSFVFRRGAALNP